MDIFNDD